MADNIARGRPRHLPKRHHGHAGDVRGRPCCLLQGLPASSPDQPGVFVPFDLLSVVNDENEVPPVLH